MYGNPFSLFGSGHQYGARLMYSCLSLLGGLMDLSTTDRLFCKRAVSASFRSCSSAGSFSFPAAISLRNSCIVANGNENTRGAFSNCGDCVFCAGKALGKIPKTAKPRTNARKALFVGGRTSVLCPACVSRSKVGPRAHNTMFRNVEK